MDKFKTVKEYIKDNLTPLWLEGFDSKQFKNSVVVEANAPKTEFAVFMGRNGAVFPSWYNAVLEKKNEQVNLLVFEDIDRLSEEEQERFLEIVKYRTISNAKLPDNCCIILTSSSTGRKINPKLSRFLTYIKI
ncbi:MAG: tail fiber assembly protein [Christensenellaceae bacterium]|jgi:hemerythrin superfamily protein|nr:tail fiber assembly protein [Christensenellaceae bacterium]